MKDLINCPAERAIYFLGGKWKIRILFTLYNSKKVRFNELKKVLKTINGGVSWIEQSTPFSNDIIEICFVDENYS